MDKEVSSIKANTSGPELMRIDDIGKRIEKWKSQIVMPDADRMGSQRSGRSQDPLQPKNIYALLNHMHQTEQYILVWCMSMRTTPPVKRLSKLGETFTIDDVKEISDMSDEVLWNLLYRLENQGWIERIERGKYMIIPLGAEKGRYTLNEFVIGSMLVEPCCISYWSALHYYGFTEQIPSTVFMQTTARKKNQNIEVFGVRYKIIKITEEKFFGIDKVWFESKTINITDKEKTIVDCLDKTKYSGGIIEVIKAIKEQSFNKVKIVDYVSHINNSGVARRLGYLCEYYDIEIDLPAINKNIRNYLSLDPGLPDSGFKNSKWRLVLNLSEDMMENIE